jgi:putative transposase
LSYGLRGLTRTWRRCQSPVGRVGAEHGERTPQRRTHRNGYRPRAWETQVGQIELAIHRLRRGSCFPSFLGPRWRAEQALVAVVQEAYVNRVPTRRVDRLVEQPAPANVRYDAASPMDWKPPLDR